ncbi:CpaD family pilus assembly lipoprotein [Stutzerimonas kirkiae]|uniref:CpaD family pilus assembly lipoprotein n=1 Tax=Stutzerimonas kirkiae TaxID=2211392 RepID=UPI0010384238|nr:CpaD family pilus assembly lipoprotein [Stutzerimonas kirkiae]TBV09170.1 pilus assembly protein CpaD [Stutzerimonas kirkiae]TBV12149.1 pilus assembly protein CpaD [Stutzerimonas kirkiae]
MTVRPLLSLLALSLLVTGCDRNLNQMRENRFTPYQSAPLPTVTPSAMVASLKAAGNGSFSAESLDNLNTLLRAQGRLSRQTLSLQPYTPSGERLAQRLAAVLRDRGTPAEQIIVMPVRLEAAEARQWDLQVVSEALVVKTPDCSIADAEVWTVKPYQAIGPMGCANRANIARMVSDPSDLVRPRTLDAGDGIAAVNAVTRYYDDEVRELLDIDFQED